MRITIKFKLIVTFSLITLILIFLGSYSKDTLKNVNNKSSIIAEKWVPRMDFAHSLNKMISSYRLMEFEHIISPIIVEKNELEEKMDSQSKEIQRILSEYSKTLINEEDKILNDTAKINWENYLQVHTKIITLSRDYKTDIAMLNMKGESKEVYDKISNTFVKMVDKNSKDTKAASIESTDMYNTSTYILNIIIIITIALSIIASILLISSVMTPTIILKKRLQELADKGGDLTQQIKVKSQDEIGDLANSVNQFISNIRSIIVEVNECSKNVTNSANIVSEHLHVLSEDVETTTATVETLSAGMEETAASTEEMYASANQIEHSIEKVTTKASDGSIAANEIRNRANILQNNALNSQLAADEMYQYVKENLEIAVNRSKAVNQIEFLSKIIFEITSQTKVLSLNASIEAAKAGESGKGFSIVAKEIGKLATKSNKAVLKIQSFSKEVLLAVNSLIESSNKIIDFMDTNVANDYKQMISTAKQYSGDTALVDNLVNEFCTTSKDLTSSIESIIGAVGEVSHTITDGSLGIQDIAEKSSDIVIKVSEVQKQMDVNIQNAHKLKKAVGKFKVF